jgi:hypothetical protein
MNRLRTRTGFEKVMASSRRVGLLGCLTWMGRPATLGGVAAVCRLTAVACLVSSGACGGDVPQEPPRAPLAPPSEPPPAAATASATTQSASAEAASADSAPPPREPTEPPALVQGTAAADPPKPYPTARIVAPKAGQLIAADAAAEFAVKLDVTRWETAVGAAHVHLILDNRPYKAIYDTKAPMKLSELLGGDAISEGQHVLVAFPSRATHESVKTPGALSIVEFFVGKAKTKGDVDVKKPLLVYSRPKGDYKGDQADHILIDFQLANVKLAPQKEQVLVRVEGPGIEGSLTRSVESFGAPLYLDHARSGTYRITTTLLSARGEPMPGPWNATTREIKVDRTPPAPAAPPHSPHEGH